MTAAGGTTGRFEPYVVLGVLSLILWALIVVVTLKYVVIFLRADNNGEGGTLALMALAQRVVGSNASKVILLGIIGGALFYGDAVITPAVSVLSAVEGMTVVTSAFEPYAVPVTALILVLLFAVQSRGTASVAAFFGPAMCVWFAAIAVAAIPRVVEHPYVLLAFNPLYAVTFMLHHGVIGFVTLGAVFLAVTGAEALYADLGHFGKPHGVAGVGIAGARVELSGAGRAAAGQSQGHRESLLPDVSAMGAAADGCACDRGDRDRQPGRDYRRLFADAASDPAWSAAAL
jgi:KUP system potassium uptake protein